MTSQTLLELGSLDRLSTKTARFLLGILLLWAFGLRAWNATPDLTSTRFWDERYGLQNIELLLRDGQWRPAHGLHPGLSYLPHALVLKGSDLLYEITGEESFAVLQADSGFTPTAYLLCRMLQAVFGTLSLLLVYLIGTRLGNNRLGLLAAFLLAVVPWHIRQSVIYKADMVLVLAVVLAFYLSLRAIERPTFSIYAATGVAIGLAMASKFNAGPAAIPVTLGTLLSSQRSRKTFLWLVAAGAISVAVFLLFNPYVLIEPEIYRRSMSRTVRVYARKGRAKGVDTPLDLVPRTLDTLTSPSFHGLLIGIAAFIGLGVLIYLSIRYLRRSKIALFWLMALSFVLSYAVLYAVSTPNPSPHNWLPLAPFLALAAAWSLLAIWSILGEHLPAQPQRLIGTTAATGLVLFLGWPANVYTYKSTVPSTGNTALKLLTKSLKQPPGRQVVSEFDFKIPRMQEYRRARLALQQVDSLNLFSRQQLDRFDSEVFPGVSLEDPEQGPFYRGRMDRLPETKVHVIRPRLFKAWGPEIVVLVHPLQPSGEPEPGEWVRTAEDRRLYAAQLPSRGTPGGPISLQFRRPSRSRKAELRGEGEGSSVVDFRGPDHRPHQITRRFDATEEVTLRFDVAPKADRIAFILRRWQEVQRAY
ncbi:MAG: glycosyltransferase family 39 protein [Thermoanaerobaculia bacterium]